MVNMKWSVAGDARRDRRERRMRTATEGSREDAKDGSVERGGAFESTHAGLRRGKIS